MKAIGFLASKPLAVLLSASFALAACHDKAAQKSAAKAATTETFTHGMLDYLALRGNLCLGKQFPLDVSEGAQRSGARDALQMPVLEGVGLVTSTDATGTLQTEDGSVPVKVRRYELTDTGRLYYLMRPVPGQSGAHAMRGDLCAVKLTLDTVVGFELSPAAKPPSAVVTYTYRVQPAPWTSIADVQRVFPAVTNVISGAGSAQLKEGFTLTDAGWVANELVPSAPAVATGAAPVANR